MLCCVVHLEVVGWLVGWIETPVSDSSNCQTNCRRKEQSFPFCSAQPPYPNLKHHTSEPRNSPILQSHSVSCASPTTCVCTSYCPLQRDSVTSLSLQTGTSKNPHRIVLSIVHLKLHAPPLSRSKHSLSRGASLALQLLQASVPDTKLTTSACKGRARARNCTCHTASPRCCV